MRVSACFGFLILMMAPVVAAGTSIAKDGAARTDFIQLRSEARALVNLCDIDLRLAPLAANLPYGVLPLKEKVNLDRAVDLEVARFERLHEQLRGARACSMAIEKFGVTGGVTAGLISKP